MSSTPKKIFAVCLLAFISLTGFLTIRNLYGNNSHLGWGADAQTDKRIIRNLPGNDRYLLPAFALSRMTGKHYFNDSGVWIEPDGQMTHAVASCDMTENAQAVARLYRDSRRLRKKFLFVLCPGKPVSDERLSDYGFDAYTNRNADKMLELLKNFGVPCLDLRPGFLESMGEDVSKYFYRTDHHWNTSGGLLAARSIADELNSLYDLGIESELLQEDRYIPMTYPASWIGEMGQKCYGIFSEPDDFEVLWPDFDHKITYVDDDQEIRKEGKLDIVLNKESLSEDHLSPGRSMYYSYMYENNTLVSLTNHHNMSGRLFMVKDSLSNVCVPYLALAAKQIVTWDVREKAETDMYTFLETQPSLDAVLVCYQSETVSNSSMFSFRTDMESPLHISPGSKAARKTTDSAEGAESS